MTDERKPMANIAPFGLRMQPELKLRVEDAARTNNRSLNAEIVERLERSFDTDHQQWEAYLRFLRAEQNHIENMYLTGKTNDFFYRDKTVSPAKLTPLVRDVSDLVNRRTQLAMEVIVKELERRGMLSPGGVPTSDEWRELREAAREVQPDILAALANLDVEKALQIARDSEHPLPTFSYDLFVEEWIEPISKTADTEDQKRLIAEANAHIKRYKPELSVWLSSKGGVAFGFRSPKDSSADDIRDAQALLDPLHGKASK
nr:Arc family DNA-binding protein [Aminobacter aminovorans]